MDPDSENESVEGNESSHLSSSLLEQETRDGDSVCSSSHIDSSTVCESDLEIKIEPVEIDSGDDLEDPLKIVARGNNGVCSSSHIDHSTESE